MKSNGAPYTAKKLQSWLFGDEQDSRVSPTSTLTRRKLSIPSFSRPCSSEKAGEIRSASPSSSSKSEIVVIPITRALENPYARFYFLVYLMHTGQHFDLYLVHKLEIIPPKPASAPSLLHLLEQFQIESNEVTDNDLIIELRRALKEAKAEMIQELVCKLKKQCLDRVQGYYKNFVQSKWYSELLQDEFFRENSLAIDQQLQLQLLEFPPGMHRHYLAHYHIEHDRIDVENRGQWIAACLRFHVDRMTNEIRMDTCALLNHKETLDQQVLFARIRHFLVPSQNLSVAKVNRQLPPAKVFTFLIRTEDRFVYRRIYGAVYRAYSNDPDDEYYRAQGVCLISFSPMIQSLRNVLVETLGHLDQALLLSHDQIAGIIEKQVLQQPVPSSIDFSLELLFRSFQSHLLLEIVGNLLLENQVLMIASDYSKLQIIGESLRVLLHPLQWCHVYAPLVPESLLSAIDCPSPFFAGVCKATAAAYDTASGIDITNKLVVDIDQGLIYGDSKCCFYPNQEHQRPLPPIFHQANVRLRQLLHPELSESWDMLSTEFRVCSSGAAFPETEIRDIMKHLVMQLLKYHELCSLVVDHVPKEMVIFNSKLFCQDFHSREETSFLEAFLQTQHFSDYITRYSMGLYEKQVDQGPAALNT